MRVLLLVLLLLVGCCGVEVKPGPKLAVDPWVRLPVPSERLVRLAESDGDVEAILSSHRGALYIASRRLLDSPKQLRFRCYRLVERSEGFLVELGDRKDGCVSLLRRAKEELRWALIRRDTLKDLCDGLVNLIIAYDRCVIYFKMRNG